MLICTPIKSYSKIQIYYKTDHENNKLYLKKSAKPYYPTCENVRYSTVTVYNSLY